MPLSPKRVIHRKVQRGREKGNATRDNHIDFGDIALVAMEPTWLDARVIEAAIFPDKPITKKPAEVRMGKGKGAPDHWAAVIKPGMILFEVGGVDINLAHRALELAADKLPVITKIAVKPTRD